jgi:hypothetical protein
MAQGLLDVVSQVGRGFEKIYDEQVPTMDEIRGLLGMPEDMSSDPAAQYTTDVPSPRRNPVKDYFKNYVGHEELNDTDRSRTYDRNKNAFQVYQLKGEKRPTVGEGLFLDDAALKAIGLNKVPKVGTYIPAEKVNSLVSNRWANAYERASKELAGTKGESSIGPLAEMIFQMGAGVVNPKNKTKYFAKTLRLLKEGKVKEAQEEAKNSPGWYGKTTSRAERVISRFGKGEL